MEEKEQQIRISAGSVETAACPACGAEMDTGGIEPFTPVSCPACGAEFEIPARFGQFLLLKTMGHGGMGGVYLGRDEMLDRQVAIKVMLKELGDDPEFTSRFQREAQAAAKLNHPNIAQIYSFGTEKGQPYIAMELVPNGSLDKKMEKEPGGLDPAWAMKTGLQIATGLSVAAEAGLVHGDVKPENILFDSDGNAKLVDFGLAAMQGDSNEIWGTPYYISPEKTKRQKIDFRADIYSLGATLYHGLVGRPPFDGPDAAAVVKARLGGVPEKPSAIRPEIPPAVDAIIMRMLEEDPARRYPTYESLIGDINRYLSEAAKSGRKIGLGSGKKIVLKSPSRPAGQRMQLKLSRLGAASAPGDAGADGGFDDVPEIGAVPVNAVKEGMSPGAKVGIVAGSILGALAVFGLVMWLALKPKDNTEEVNAKARESIRENNKSVAASREKMKYFVDEQEKAVSDALEALKRSTKNLAEFSPQDAPFLRFPEPKDLAEARKQLREANGTAEPETKGEEGKPDVDGVSKENARIAAERRLADDPTRLGPDEDPADPDVQDRIAKALAEKKAREEAEGKTAGASPAPAAAAGAPAAPAQGGAARKISFLADKLRNHWSEGHKVELRLLKLRLREKEFNALCENYDATASAPVTPASAQAAGTTASAITEMLGNTESEYKDLYSKASVLKTRLESFDRDIVDRAQRRKRKQEAAEKEAAHQKRVAQEDEKRRKDYEESKVKQTALAAEKYALVEQLLKSQSWDIAVNQLKRDEPLFTTSEGHIAFEDALHKVEYMRDLHKWLIESAKGMKLSPYESDKSVRAKLKNPRQNGQFVVESADASTITIVFRYKDARNKDVVERVPGKIVWSKMYSEYKFWLNNLIYTRVEHVFDETLPGGKEENPFRFKRNKKQYSSDLMGAALTYRTYFPDDKGALKRASALIAKAIEDFPDRADEIRRIFPDVKDGK